jgi:hypothetical protein
MPCFMPHGCAAISRQSLKVHRQALLDAASFACWRFCPTLSCGAVADTISISIRSPGFRDPATGPTLRPARLPLNSSG